VLIRNIIPAKIPWKDSMGNDYSFQESFTPLISDC